MQSKIYFKCFSIIFACFLFTYPNLFQEYKIARKQLTTSNLLHNSSKFLTFAPKLTNT